MTRKLHAKSKAVAHHLPHRTRLKLPKEHRDPATLKRVHERLKKTAGVSDVEINERTGSVLIHHEEDPVILDNVSTALEDVCEELFEAVLAAEGIEIPGLSIIAHVIREGLSHADNRLADATNNLIDLKMLVPIAFFGAGVFQARRNQGWFGQAPAWILFYFAYDAYMKFHGPSVRETSAEERVDVYEQEPQEKKKPIKRISMNKG
ncbi:MAG TPA: hypothetical protein V6C86_16140 [Oculatellaceae cyanobacterium]